MITVSAPGTLRNSSFLLHLSAYLQQTAWEHIVKVLPSTQHVETPASEMRKSPQRARSRRQGLVASDNPGPPSGPMHPYKLASACIKDLLDREHKPGYQLKLLNEVLLTIAPRLDQVFACAQASGTKHASDESMKKSSVAPDNSAQVLEAEVSVDMQTFWNALKSWRVSLLGIRLQDVDVMLASAIHNNPATNLHPLVGSATALAEATHPSSSVSSPSARSPSRKAPSPKGSAPAIVVPRLATGQNVPEWKSPLRQLRERMRLPTARTRQGRSAASRISSPPSIDNAFPQGRDGTREPQLTKSALAEALVRLSLLHQPRTRVINRLDFSASGLDNGTSSRLTEEQKAGLGYRFQMFCNDLFEADHTMVLASPVRNMLVSSAELSVVLHAVTDSVLRPIFLAYSELSQGLFYTLDPRYAEVMGTGASVTVEEARGRAEVLAGAHIAVVQQQLEEYDWWNMHDDSEEDEDEDAGCDDGPSIEQDIDVVPTSGNISPMRPPTMVTRSRARLRNAPTFAAAILTSPDKRTAMMGNSHDENTVGGSARRLQFGEDSQDIAKPNASNTASATTAGAAHKPVFTMTGASTAVRRRIVKTNTFDAMCLPAWLLFARDHNTYDRTFTEENAADMFFDAQCISAGDADALLLHQSAAPDPIGPSQSLDAPDWTTGHISSDQLVGANPSTPTGPRPSGGQGLDTIAEVASPESTVMGKSRLRAQQVQSPVKLQRRRPAEARKRFSRGRRHGKRSGGSARNEKFDTESIGGDEKATATLAALVPGDIVDDEHDDTATQDVKHAALLDSTMQSLLPTTLRTRQMLFTEFIEVSCAQAIVPTKCPLTKSFISHCIVKLQLAICKLQQLASNCHHQATSQPVFPQTS